VRSWSPLQLNCRLRPINWLALFARPIARELQGDLRTLGVSLTCTKWRKAPPPSDNANVLTLIEIPCCRRC
jgi:hypothetical protein